jgi:hypothetical protein
MQENKDSEVKSSKEHSDRKKYNRLSIYYFANVNQEK